MPTEAEWEYACRGGAASKQDCSFNFYFTEATNSLTSDDANFGNKLQRTTKVGTYKPNRLGLYDMHGNVKEWTDSFLQEGASLRVSRGGGWLHGADDCRAAFRHACEPLARLNDLARLARVPVGKEVVLAEPKKEEPPPVGWNTSKPGAVSTNSLGMKFAYIPRGTFWMGGGGGTAGDKQVTIPHLFFFGVYKVTQKDWQDVTGQNPSWFSRDGQGKDGVKDIPDAELSAIPSGE